MTRSQLLGAAGLFTLALAVVSTAGASPGGRPDQLQSLHEAAVRDLAPSGQIRACTNPVNVALNTVDPATGELRGVAVDIPRELGVRLGVEVVLTGYPSDADREQALAAGESDVIFTSVTPGALQIVDLTPPLVVVVLTLLVRESSSIQSMADMDRPGVRVIPIAREAGGESAVFWGGGCR